MFAQESVMEIQKEREAFQKFCEENFDFERHEQTYFDEQTQCYENDIGEDTESINMAWMAWQAAKAQAVPEGFVLIKDDTKTVVAIERMVEQQVEASGMDSRRLERLDGWKIIEAAVKAQEPTND
jgi:CRISPR/Cas system-associated protein Csx1